jgi:hypothetical protein
MNERDLQRGEATAHKKHKHACRGCSIHVTASQERDERAENSDDEGEDLMDGAERDYMPVPELDTYEEDQVFCHTTIFASHLLACALPPRPPNTLRIP